MTASNPPSGSIPALRVIDNDDEIDLESLEVLKAFCLDPLSDATGQLIDAHAARRARRGCLTAISGALSATASMAPSRDRHKGATSRSP
ncbi:MAG: hypothetical protein IPG63_07510 [Xanthomonadales bacterium]|nr:hypothetical protein [Xanthomonadales bacterium]